MRQTFYRSYPESIKVQVANSKNPNLFPDLNIPRKTAMYWIERKVGESFEMNLDQIVDERIRSARKEIDRERSLRVLHEKVRKIFPYDFSTQRVKGNVRKRKIVAASNYFFLYH